MTMTTDLWLRNYRPRPAAGVQLVCFPHAGGSASYFHPLAQAIGPGVEVRSVQYPGRQDRRHEPLIDDVRTLADRISVALRPLTDRPIALFGHSMGAAVAFEVGLRLAGPPVALFVSGRTAPSRHRSGGYDHLLGDAELLAAVARLGGTDQAISDDEELRRMILPAIRNDYRAIERYPGSADAALDCPIVACTGDADPKATVAEVRGWATHTTKEFDLRVFAGGHFYLNRHQAELTALIEDRLAAVTVG